MLLVHQTGSVRVGEVVRYTLTYVPSRDRVRPVPANLHVRIRNTCAIALRAAYLHGPYTLYAACYSSAFNPNADYSVKEYGEPQFEPNLKAGGSWTATLKIPDSVRAACEEPSSSGKIPETCVWVIECTSQVLFSSSAKVHYEVIVGRDEKSVEVGFAGLTGSVSSTPGRLIDHKEEASKENEQVGPVKGIYSNAVTLVVEDTATLWDKPKLPGLNYFGFHEYRPHHDQVPEMATGNGPKKRVHLVIITHGLHSNLGADMLFLKESIDAAAKQARLDARLRKKMSLTKVNSHPIHDYTESSPPPPDASKAQVPATSTAPTTGGQEDVNLEDDEEEVVVRGFSGNAVRTERGIQYLGKRLAKYVLGMTYPDQQYLPVKKSIKKTLSRTFTGKLDEQEIHRHSSVRYGGDLPLVDRPYKITSISFIGHSLGGLTQMYAIAYIQKHSPEFFLHIQPVNFIALASPMLGLSNENPLYVRFALDFGLVGRTGQDLGLTWRAPTIARSGWAGMIAGIGTERQRAPKRVDPGTKPLLRLLPSGPAHQALRMFRNRTVYSNVVNDGIVPLRTSCLLFLDWRGLDKVEKARRENGLIGTMAGWGWAELTGTNTTEHRNQWPWQKQSQDGDRFTSEDESVDTSLENNGNTVPQPSDNATATDYSVNSPETKTKKQRRTSLAALSPSRNQKTDIDQDEPTSPLAGLMSFFGSGSSKKTKPEQPEQPKRKQLKAIKRAQTLKMGSDESGRSTPSPEPTRSLTAAAGESDVHAPPKTSVFEAAGDLLNPPLPELEFLVDPRSRPRTIFHDRIYHPEDIPPPPIRRKSTFKRRDSRTPRDGVNDRSPTATYEEPGSMPVEEKIARAYHRDLSWRKVLVRLSPDAHNNMVVRRMFANAYGWPVVKHIVDTHFADTHTALTADSKEANSDRARPTRVPANEVGDEVKGQRRRASGDTIGDDERKDLEEAVDELRELTRPGDLGSLGSGASIKKLKSLDRQDSVESSAWTDKFFDGDSSDDEVGYGPEHEIIRDHIERQTNNCSETMKRNEDEAKDSSEKGSVKPETNLVLPVDKVVESPTSLSPVGLGASINERMNLGRPRE